MAFNKEDKITLEELSPSFKNLLDGLSTQINKEKENRIIEDNELRKLISDTRNNVKNMIDNKYNSMIQTISNLEEKANNIFDSDGRLIFPNGKKFWISDSISDSSKYKTNS